MTLLMREQEKFEEGIQQGIQQGIIKQINTLKKLKIKENEIISIMIEDYNMSEEEIRKYL